MLNTMGRKGFSKALAPVRGATKGIPTFSTRGRIAFATTSPRCRPVIPFGFPPQRDPSPSTLASCPPVAGPTLRGQLLNAGEARVDQDALEAAPLHAQLGV